ncbi:hypothetical protein F750_3077 [Streptomyces sp. PAMC 26508]|nr:hypothetical protein F750_3077 [Streptomyces sp. PAMC 26508]
MPPPGVRLVNGNALRQYGRFSGIPVREQGLGGLNRLSGSSVKDFSVRDVNADQQGERFYVFLTLRGVVVNVTTATR